MTTNEKIEHLQKIKSILASFDTETQRSILWHLLQTSLSGDTKAINWFFEQFGKFIDGECNRLISPFQ